MHARSARFSFPGSAWEPATREALPRAACCRARQSLAGSAFPGRAWEREEECMDFDYQQVWSAWDPWRFIPAEYNLGVALTSDHVRAGRGSTPALLWENAAG